MQELETQREKVKALKMAGASKEDIAPEVKKLLALKKAVGEDVQTYVYRLHATFCGGADFKGGYKDKFDIAKGKNHSVVILRKPMKEEKEFKRMKVIANIQASIGGYYVFKVEQSRHSQ